MSACGVEGSGLLYARTTKLPGRRLFLYLSVKSVVKIFLDDKCRQVGSYYALRYSAYESHSFI